MLKYLQQNSEITTVRCDVVDIKKPESYLDNSIVHLYKTAREKKDEVEHAVALGRAYNLREYTEEAKEVLEDVLKIDPYNNLGWYELIFSVGHDEAMKALVSRVEKTFKADENSFIKLRNLALIYNYLGKVDKANEYCKEIVKLPNKDYTAYEVCAYLKFWQNEFDEALDAVRKSLAIYERNPRSWRLLGHCYFEKGDYIKAEDAYRKSVGIEENYVRGWFSLGQVILNTKHRIIDGIRCLMKASAINPFYWNTYFTLINYYLGNKMYIEAMGECRRIINLSSDDSITAEAYNYLGLLHYSQSEYRPAMSSFNIALELKPDTAFPFYYIGQIYFKTNEYSKALEYFEKAIELDPVFAWAYTQSGFALIELKKYAEAEQKFKKALELDEEEYWAYMGLADIQRKRRKPKKQLQMMKKSAEIEPNDSDVQNRLGIAYECNGLYEDAEKSYLFSLELDPLNRKSANNLGYLYEKLYNRTDDPDYKEKAIETWKKRLLICRDTDSSIRGAINHLTKLGVRESLIDKWIEIGELKTEVKESEAK
jgi:tetratricopeptide (TPR) repeat protein